MEELEMKKLGNVSLKNVFKKEVIIFLAWALMMVSMPNFGLFLIVLYFGGTYVARAMAHWEAENLSGHIFWSVLGVLPLPTLCIYAVYYWQNKFGMISETGMFSGFKYSILLSAGLIAIIFFGLMIHILVKFFPKRNRA